MINDILIGLPVLIVRISGSIAITTTVINAREEQINRPFSGTW